MKEYKIRRARRTGEDYETMVIMDNETAEAQAEYRLTPGCERAEIARMRRAINHHLDDGGTQRL